MHARHGAAKRHVTAADGVDIFGIGRDQGLLGRIWFGHDQVLNWAGRKVYAVGPEFAV